MKLILALLAVFALSATAYATPGALNKHGCHGRNGPQGYHCHKKAEHSRFHNGRRRFVAWGH